MRIILRQDIESLGNIGEIVNVKPGYARNYLIPHQFAYFATKGAVNKIEQEARTAKKESFVFLRVFFKVKFSI